MKSLVIYDSVYGNTKLVAEVIANILDATIKSVNDNIDLNNVEMLIVGSPINGWMATPKMNDFINNLKPDSLKDIKVATFDTRVKLFIHGNAMLKMAKLLEEKGAKYLESKAFYVGGKKGNLLAGELDNAKAWALSLKRY